MKVELLSLSAPIRPGSLASASVKLIFDNDSTLRIADLRVFRSDETNELWVGMPMFKTPNGHVFQALLASRRIKRMIEDVVLAAYEKWASVQPKGSHPSTTPSFDCSPAACPEVDRG